jgi:hypothetical protein
MLPTPRLPSLATLLSATLFLCTTLFSPTHFSPALFATTLADPWYEEYDSADGSPDVIALWQFHAGAELEDSSGNGHHLELSGAELTEEGKFGGGLRSFAGWPVDDQRHAAVARAHPDLSPSGAFSIDLWIKPSPEMPRQGNVHLICKKYVSHHDYQLAMIPYGSGRRALQLALGFGTESETFVSEPAEWPADAWQHVAITYDGAGTVRFYRNGTSFGGRSSPGRQSISAGPLALSIADRTGSLYGGFPGVLDQIRISRGVREFRPASVRLTSERAAYRRMETASPVAITVRNHLPSSLEQSTLEITGWGPARSMEIPPLPSGSQHDISLPLDTSLRPGDYELRARLRAAGPPAVYSEETLRVTLAPRPLPRMPVVMWGMGSPDSFQHELPRLLDLGFTHCLGFGPDYAATWDSGKPEPIAADARAGAIQAMFDTALTHQFGIAANLSPGSYLKGKDDLQRVDREGKPYERRDVNAALPGIAEFGENIGMSVARTFGHHPAFEAAMINTEVRDSSQLSFSEFDRKKYREASGRDIPEEVTIKNGVPWRDLDDFPKDRVVPDDHPILEFYRWFWTVGDGWNQLHSATHRGLKSTGRKDLWTWFDPAIRVPSIAGSGGQVDVLGQWTYTEPSPLRVGYFTDELLAMAALAPHDQRTMKMTQLFWYRTTSAPIKEGTEYIANPFDDHDPDAAYITIAPAHLRQSFWTKIARPVSGLMYHGWASLVPTDGTSAYKFTQPDTQTEFRRLHREVLEPLGPMLLDIPEGHFEVAYLNSFTAQMFARRGSYGYSHDEAYLTLLHAQLQPEVIFEETLLSRGLGGYRVLVLADCDVLPRSVVDRILEFQREGGLIIGDPNLTPAIRPDVVLPKFTRTRKAAEDKATLLQNAARLQQAIHERYTSPVTCSNPEIIARLRTAGTTDYIFVVNDHREAGSYVGRHGLVQDQGLPSEGVLTLRRKQGHVYDFNARSMTPNGNTSAGDSAESGASPPNNGGTLRWPVVLGPCEGNVYVVTERPIERIIVRTVEEVTLGDSCEVTIDISSDDEQLVEAVLPVQLEVLDPHGRPAEFSGYHATASGRLTLTLDLASNDTPGVWTIRARELVTGRMATRFMRVME